MSITYKMSLSDDLVRVLNAARGPLSLQEFTLLALLDKCNGSAVEQELRRQVDQLQYLLAQRAVPLAVAETAMPCSAAPTDERLEW